MHPDPRDILGHYQARCDAMVEELATLLRIETPSHDAERIRAFVGHVRGELEAAGAACAELPGPVGPQLHAVLDGAGPPIVLVGHSDTVWPVGTLDVRPVTVRDGRLEGPGAYDMKAGVSLAIELFRFFRDTGLRPRRRLELFLAADEEKGSLTAHPEMDRVLQPDSTVLVLEPPCPNGDLKIRRKGVGIYHVTVQGKEAHAGVAPDEGVSAVDELARLILELHGWKDPDRGIRLNVGRIEGGTTSNVVAGLAWCEVDLRYDRPEDGDAIDRRLRELRPLHPAARFVVEGGLYFPPLVPTDASRRLGERAAAVGAEIGLRIGLGSSGGGSDGSWLAARGFTVLDGLGVDGSGAHAVDEHILVDRLPLRAALLTGLVLTLDDDR